MMFQGASSNSSVISREKECSHSEWLEQGGVENVQYATNHKRKGGGSAHAIGSARPASMMTPL